MFSRLSSQKESREFSATIFYSTAFCSVDNEGILHEVLHESVCYSLNDVELNAKPRAPTFLVRLACSIPFAAVYKLRFTLDKPEKNIFMFRTHFDIFIIQAYTTIWSIIKKK